MQVFSRAFSTMMLFTVLSLPAFSQQMKMIQSTEIFELPEIGGVIGREKDQVKILAALPKERRVKAYQEADLQEGDLILFLNGKRIKGVKEIEQGYAAAAIGDTIQFGLQRKEDRLIAALVKADPKNLPATEMRRIMVSSDGRMTTEHIGGGEVQRTQRTFDPNASEITPVMALGVVVGSVNGEVKVLDKLPVPARGLEGVDLQKDDVLQALNGQKIASVQQFNEAFEKIAVGVKTELQYLRKQQTMTASFLKPEAQGRMMFRW